MFSYFRKGMRGTERGRGETKKGREKGRIRRKAEKGEKIGLFSFLTEALDLKVSNKQARK